jgi:hypothetical protein
MLLITLNAFLNIQLGKNFMVLQTLFYFCAFKIDSDENH